MNLRRLVATALALGAAAFANGDASIVAAPRPLHWILNGPAVAAFASDARSVKFFAGSAPFVVQREATAVALPSPWHAVPTRIFTSEALLERAFANGAVDPSTQAVIYDDEAWQFTPQEEQHDFAGATKRAAAIVHAHGMRLIAAPAVDLVRVLAPEDTGKRYDAYLRLGIARESARYADAVEIQAQGSETALAQYASFVDAAAAQAHAVNPHVMVLAGISTNPTGNHVTAAQVKRAIDATRASVDGYWFNVPKPSEYCPQCNDFRPDIAIDVLTRLGR